MISLQYPSLLFLLKHYDQDNKDKDAYLSFLLSTSYFQITDST